MKKITIIIIALFFSLGVVSSTSQSSIAKTEKYRSSAWAVPGRYIVVLNDAASISRDRLPDAANRLSDEYNGRIDRLFNGAVKGFSAKISKADAEKLSSDPRVAYVEEDGIVETSEVQQNATWGISRIDQREWVYPLSTDYEYSKSGLGTNVYVVDTGVLVEHPEFEGRAVDAFNASRDRTPIAECNGHGTHVAGTIGSRTYGVAKNASILSVRVFPCWGNALVSDVVSGLDWIQRHGTGPAVVNMSLAATRSSTMDSAVQSLINKGFTVVAAAGNGDTDACSFSPAHISDVITVGATDNRDFKSNTSNFGPCVDIYAPGVGIESTWNQYPAPIPTNIMSGTSTASPHAAGAAALYLEMNPAAKPADVSAAILSASTQGIVQNISADSINRFLFTAFSALSDAPPAPCAGNAYSGMIAFAGEIQFQSGQNGFSASTGKFSASLTSANSASFRLKLEKKKRNGWVTAASAEGTGAVSISNYNGKSGTYRWDIEALSDGVDYTLCSVTP